VKAAYQWGFRDCVALAAIPQPEPAGLDVERLTDELVQSEIHRVLCMNAKHRSPFTGQCQSGGNIAHGLRARLAATEAKP
jgi:hypothetical protein